MKSLFGTAILAAAMLFTACSDETNSGNENEAELIDSTAVVANPLHPDSIDFSFVFVGCNRIDWTDTLHSGTNLSTANLPQLQRTWEEVCKLEPKPKYFFFLGDLVLGLDKDTTILGRELRNWIAQYHDTDFSPISTSGIEMIAVPGNHEMLWYSDNGEIPWQESTNLWWHYMQDFVPSLPMNRVGGADSLNNRLTYSFTNGNTHFILLNTDTYNPAEEIGRVPADWIVSDIEAARANPAVEHIFLMGHKPSYVDQDNEIKGDKEIDTTQTMQFWPVMEDNRVEAMLSAHSHQYWRCQPNDKCYQIVAGNGGSPLNTNLKPDQQFFGYTVVHVLKNGKVHLQSKGRMQPAAGYLAPIPASDHDTIFDNIDISWGSHAPAWDNWKVNIDGK